MVQNDASGICFLSAASFWGLPLAGEQRWPSCWWSTRPGESVLWGAPHGAMWMPCGMLSTPPLALLYPPQTFTKDSLLLFPGI